MLCIIPILGPTIRICKAGESLDASPIVLLAINLETNFNILCACLPALTPRVRKCLRRLWSTARSAANQHTCSESSNDRVVSDPEKVICGVENKIGRDDKLVGFDSRNATGTSSDNLIKNEGIAV
jgi:hypothetical protein